MRSAFHFDEDRSLQSAEAAKALGIKIYTIGAGTRGQAPFVVDGFFGQQVVYQDVEIDEETLEAIAETTGGAYFRARDAEALARIYEQLDELEPVESDQEAIRPVDELFYWPLSAAFLITLAGVLVMMLPGMRREWLA